MIKRITVMLDDENFKKLWTKQPEKIKNPQNWLVFLEWLTIHYEPLSECLFAFSVKNENLNIL